MLIGLAEIPTHGGAVAQLGERLNGIQEVGGSIPLSSTNKIKAFLVSDSIGQRDCPKSCPNCQVLLHAQVLP